MACTLRTYLPWDEFLPVQNATAQERTLDGVIPEASGGYYAEQHECEANERRDEGGWSSAIVVLE